MKYRGLIAVCMSAALFGQTEDVPLFRTSVSLVKVDAKVTGREGRSINDLGKNDFVVFDEGSSRPIVEFGSEKQVQPLHLLLLLDVSGSMSRLLGEMSTKASEALRQLNPADEVGLMVFATTSEIVAPFTSDWKTIPEKIVNSVFKTTRGRETYVNEALLAAAGYLNDQRTGRRAILMVTDNEGTKAVATDNTVLYALQDNDIVLNAILVGANKKARGPGGRYTNPDSQQPDIFKFAENTGGDVIADEDPANALARIVRLIATRYNFQYSPPQAEPGSYRKIRVELSPDAQKRYPGAAVQARTGYYVDK